MIRVNHILCLTKEFNILRLMHGNLASMVEDTESQRSTQIRRPQVAWLEFKN